MGGDELWTGQENGGYVGEEAGTGWAEERQEVKEKWKEQMEADGAVSMWEEVK